MSKVYHDIYISKQHIRYNRHPHAWAPEPGFIAAHNSTWRGMGYTSDRPNVFFAPENLVYRDDMGRKFVVPRGCETWQWADNKGKYVSWRAGVTATRRLG